MVAMSDSCIVAAWTRTVLESLLPQQQLQFCDRLCLHTATAQLARTLLHSMRWTFTFGASPTSVCTGARRSSLYFGTVDIWSIPGQMAEVDGRLGNTF